MSDFSTDIKNFQQSGVYNYEFDSHGNLNFNSSSTDFSQVYLAFPLVNVKYNNDKLSSFYNLSFEEFIPTTASIEITASINNLQEQLDVVQQENISLKTQLDSFIAASSDNSGSVDQMAVKQVILELRKALGQGRVDSDFSDTFPYTPIRKPTT